MFAPAIFYVYRSFYGFYKFYGVDHAGTVGGWGCGGDKQGKHFLIGEGGGDLPAQRHYSDAVGDAPAQAALHVISVAALPGNVFLGYGAVGAGHAHIVWIFPGEGCDKESPGLAHPAGCGAIPLGWVEGGKTRHETRGACACALHGQYQKARVLGVGKSRLPEVGVFKKIGIPRIGRHRHGTNFFALRQGII